MRGGQAVEAAGVAVICGVGDGFGGISKELKLSFLV